MVKNDYANKTINWCCSWDDNFSPSTRDPTDLIAYYFEIICRVRAGVVKGLHADYGSVL